MKKNTITLKEKTKESKEVKARKETKLEIQDVKLIAYILSKLGFTYSRIMEKYRINLIFKGIKLAIGEPPFGIFIEIERPEGKNYGCCQGIRL